MRPLLDAIAWSSAFAALPPGGNAVVLLPTHSRHAFDESLATRSVEVYVSWSSGPVVSLESGTPVSISWSMSDRGKHLSGEVTFTLARSGTLSVDGVMPPETVQPDIEPLVGRGAWSRFGAKLAKRAFEADWELVASLERYVMFTLDSASIAVAREIHGFEPESSLSSCPGVVDAITVEKIAGTMMYGHSESADTSVIRRMIHRCATTAINGQPLPQYLAVNIYSQAEEHIRREIGDPHVGRKVRRVARESGAGSFAEVLSIYNETHPNDQLGHRRALAALTAGRVVDAETVSGVEWLAEQSGVAG